MDSRYRGMLALNVMEFIFILIANEYDGMEGRNHTDPRIEEVMHYLSIRLDKSLKLDEVARHVSLSPSRLSHIYKSETGQSIMDTFIKMRLRHAADLLQYTTQLVEHIAEQVGYSSVYYFSTAFKTHFGVSPTAYRRQTNGH
jgi:AraC family transcriptional regulator of arabinose operon